MIDTIKRKLGIKTEADRQGELRKDAEKEARWAAMEERNARFRAWSIRLSEQRAKQVDVWENSQEPKIFILLRMADVPEEEIFRENDEDKRVFRRLWEGTSKTKLGIYTARDGTTFEVTQDFLDEWKYSVNRAGFADVATQSSGFLSGVNLTYVTTVPQVTTV